jgi:hypothetical protein
MNAPSGSEVQRSAIQASGCLDRDRLAQRLLGVAAALGMRDQFLHLVSGRRALDLDRERNLLEGSSRPFETKLVGDVEAAPHVHLGILDRHIV